MEQRSENEVNAVHILIFVFGSFYSHYPAISITAEFSSFETCEYARKHLAKMEGTAGSGSRIISQGCFKK